MGGGTGVGKGSARSHSGSASDGAWPGAATERRRAIMSGIAGFGKCLER